jgi:acyl carrier protein
MFARIKKILVDDLHVDAAEVTLDAELINDLGINSLELADLICACEEEFDLEIGDDDLREFITVGDVVKYLEENAQ